MILFKGRERTVLAFYLLALVISLWIGYWSSINRLEIIEGEDIAVAFDFLLYVVAFTAVFLLLAKILGDLVRVLAQTLELFFLFFTSFVLFSSILGDLGGLAWAAFLSVSRVVFSNWETVRNLSVSIIGGVASGLLGYALFPNVAAILYGLFIIYDFLSVFVTKHMLKLVESVEKIGNKKNGKIALGGGDLAIPAVFAVSLLKTNPLASIVSALGAFGGILLAFHFLRKLRHPLPALPYIGAVQLPVTVLSLYLSTLLL